MVLDIYTYRVMMTNLIILFYLSMASNNEWMDLRGPPQLIHFSKHKLLQLSWFLDSVLQFSAGRHFQHLFWEDHAITCNIA